MGVYMAGVLFAGGSHLNRLNELTRAILSDHYVFHTVI
jgi:hypothetical protein